MNAFSAFALVLPLPLFFLLHDLEELIFQHRWMLRHGPELCTRFPRLRFLITHLSRLTTPAFAIAATEELLLLLGLTTYMLYDGPYAMWIWSAAFMAFSLHLAVHLLQGILVRGYVPGLVSSLLLLPWAGYGLWSLHLVMPLHSMCLCGLCGVAVIALNLGFAHHLGKWICSKRHTSSPQT